MRGDPFEPTVPERSPEGLNLDRGVPLDEHGDEHLESSHRPTLGPPTVLTPGAALLDRTPTRPGASAALHRGATALR